MKYIILDTETTDLNGEVIQLSFMVLNNDFDVEMFKSFYCNTEELVSDGAFNVHHISNKMLEELSDGKYIEDYLLDEYKDIFFSEGVVFIGYNVGFDLKRINYSLESTGLGLPATRICPDLRRLDKKLAYQYDLMATCRRKLKQIKGLNLAEAVNRLVPKKIDCDNVYRYLCDTFNVRTAGTNYHDASYDVACTYVLLLSLSDEIC